MKQLTLPLFAFDRAIEVPTGDIAFDRASVRQVDEDGRLRVAVTNISKANVCPYLGNEIPDFDKLGLQADRIYKLLRDPDELEKAASTFNNIQLLMKHVPVSADDHQPDLVVGTTGSEAEFVAPYLRNSLAIWVREGIDLVESEVQKELSSAYRYRADMTPGVFEGEQYDGVMRDIVGNHVALVKEGRAGSDVVVGDEAIISIERTFEMSKSNLLSRKASVAQGALMVFLKPKLAKDAKIDLGPALTGLTSKNFKDKKAGLVTAITALTKDKLIAKDGKMDGLLELIDALQEVEPAEDEEDDASIDPDDAGMDADPVEAMRGFLKGKMADDDVEKACAMMKPKAMDETPEEKEAREKKEKAAAEKTAEDEDDKDKEKDMVKKPVMDAAIKVAEDAATKRAEANTMKRLNGIRIAERAVEPLIGKVTTALDSADAIYLAALKHAGVKTEGVDPSAFPALVEMAVQAKTAASKPSVHLAHDAAALTDLAAFQKQHGLPETRIRNLG